MTLEDSDDEGYTGQATRQDIFPWQRHGFTQIHDQVSLSASSEYVKAEKTDKHVKLRPVASKDVDPPRKILVVSPTSNGCDLILDLLSPLGLKVRRLGTSSSRPDLDKKFAIDFIKSKDHEAQAKAQALLEQAEIVVAAAFSLHSSHLERSPFVYDTVVIDDASMVTEADTLTALKHGCQRAILIGNPDLTQSMFLISDSVHPKTLFARCAPSFVLPGLAPAGKSPAKKN